MEVNLIILPKKNSDINLGMKRQIRQLFEKLFNDVNDSSFLINIDDNVEIQYKISSKEKNMVFLKLSCDGTSVKAAKYVCVNEIGDLIKPSYVTRSFSKLLQANGFRHIRFHDLRHSCASLLLKNGVPMKQIQEWLGHSDFSTTANIYAHLDCSSKLISADAMLNGLGMDSK